MGEKQNFGGSDFSNADIFRLSLTLDYTPTLLGEEGLDGLPPSLAYLRQPLRPS